jgi:hypothetical protein
MDESIKKDAPAPEKLMPMEGILKSGDTHVHVHIHSLIGEFRVSSIKECESVGEEILRATLHAINRAASAYVSAQDQCRENPK